MNESRNDSTERKWAEDTPQEAPVAEDIAAKKRIEEALRESEERYRILFEMEADAIFMVDQESGRFIDANPAAEKLYGFSREEFLQMNAVEISAEPAKTRHALDTQITHIPLRRHRRKDGTVFQVEIIGSYFDFRGRKTHVTTIRDITERIRMEKEMFLLSEITENMAEGVILARAADLSIVYTNRMFDAMFGYEPDELTGKNVSTLIVEASGLTMRDITYRIKEELSAKGVVSRELSFRRKGGAAAWSLANISEYKDPEQELMYIFVVQDIAEHKRAEEALRVSEERFRTQELEKMNSALKVLLAQGEKDKQELEAKVRSNIHTLVFPYLERMKKNRSGENTTYLNLIESNLHEIISSLSTTLPGKLSKLTPQEIVVACLAREGKQDKDIARILNASIHTVKTHRRSMRKKLGLNGKRVNLRNYLLNLH